MTTIDEITALRRRVASQRRELRRLNYTVSLMWKGWRYGVMTTHSNEYRARMIRAFGYDAVALAETPIDKKEAP